MARFAIRKINFGAAPSAEDEEARDLPPAKLVKLQARRAAAIREADGILGVLPAPGEMIAVWLTHRLDVCAILNSLLDRLGRCEQMRVATLGYHGRNLRMMLNWLDTGKVQSLTLLSSIFHRSHNGELWETTLKEFRARGQRAAACHSHAKVSALKFTSGERLSLCGSGNLCGNGSAREALDLIHDADLHDFHAGIIESLVAKHEQAPD
jgi:hypothetical protein